MPETSAVCTCTPIVCMLCPECDGSDEGCWRCLSFADNYEGVAGLVPWNGVDGSIVIHDAGCPAGKVGPCSAGTP